MTAPLRYLAVALLGAGLALVGVGVTCYAKYAREVRR